LLITIIHRSTFSTATWLNNWSRIRI